MQAPAITTHVRGQVEHVLQRLPKAYAGSGPHLFALSVQIRHFRVVTPTKASKASWAARSRRRRSKPIGMTSSGSSPPLRKEPLRPPDRKRVVQGKSE